MIPTATNRPAATRRRLVAAWVYAVAACAFVALLFKTSQCTIPVARAEAPQSSGFYRVIVHPQNPTVSVDREFVAQAFLKKVVTWKSGDVIHPVDLDASSPIRRKFSEEVLGRSVSAVRSYWLQIIFGGRGVPPPEVKSDEEVIRFVLHEPGAIGYVSSRADVRGAHVLTIQ
jgi:hypothetical protein